jgi:hypothetical protein
MSVTMSVFLKQSRMPSPADWATAIRANGFDMELDSDFDVRTFSGFLPCKYKNEPGGFEYFWGAARDAALEGEEAAQVGDRDAEVSFVTHSDFRELMTSVIASAVLCACADGVLWDTEAGEMIPAAKALEWARSSETAIQAQL